MYRKQYARNPAYHPRARRMSNTNTGGSNTEDVDAEELKRHISQIRQMLSNVEYALDMLEKRIEEMTRYTASSRAKTNRAEKSARDRARATRSTPKRTERTTRDEEGQEGSGLIKILEKNIEEYGIDVINLSSMSRRGYDDETVRKLVSQVTRYARSRGLKYIATTWKSQDGDTDRILVVYDPDTVQEKIGSMDYEKLPSKMKWVYVVAKHNEIIQKRQDNVEDEGEEGEELD